MKKLLIFVFSALILAGIHSTTTAQSFEENDLVINGGIGLGSTFTFAPGLGLPLGGGVEYGVADLDVGSIGVGGEFGFISGSGLTVLYIGGKGSYHFNELFNLENDDLDIYGGLGIYYRSFSFSGLGSTFGLGSGIVPAFHAGTRYYFSDNIGGYAELGNSWGWLNIGIVVKI